MANTAKWYVIHTYSGYENKVSQNIEKVVENRKLQDLIQDVRVPTETVTEADKNGQPKEVERKLFPSYVLVKMILTDDSWYVVRNIRGVTGFVGPSSKPIPLTEEEVEKLGMIGTQKSAAFSVGDEVEIISGPMESFTGSVSELDEEAGTAQIVVSMFGRETPVEVRLDQIRKAEEF